MWRAIRCVLKVHKFITQDLYNISYKTLFLFRFNLLISTVFMFYLCVGVGLLQWTVLPVTARSKMQSMCVMPYPISTLINKLAL